MHPCAMCRNAGVRVVILIDGIKGSVLFPLKMGFVQSSKVYNVREICTRKGSMLRLVVLFRQFSLFIA